MNHEIDHQFVTKTGCPVPYCRNKTGSWWLCYNCGADCCKTHEHFKNPTVSYCAICKPEKFNLSPKIVARINMIVIKPK